jgi:hypothetical protein
VVVREIADDRSVSGRSGLERDQAVAAADERVAAEPALLDRLEQERASAQRA